MWWNGHGWGPMYGWFMPIFAILFIVVVLFVFSRFFAGGGFYGRTPMDRSSEEESIKELIKEIRGLRDDIRELKKKKDE